MVLGKNITICGKIINIAKHTTISKKNGMTPRKIVYIGISLTIPATTNTFIPIGGVILDISIITTNRTPNQIKSNPRILITGRKMGSVNTVMAKLSMIQPRIAYTKRMAIKTPIDGKPKETTSCESWAGIVVNTIK